VSNFNRKKLGRWGESVVERVMRDGPGYKAFTQPEETFMPGFDSMFIKTKNDGDEQQMVSLWLQIKATSVGYKSGFNVHYKVLKPIELTAMRLIVPPDRGGFAVVSYPRKQVYFWNMYYIKESLNDAENAKGDGATPGMMILDWDMAVSSYPLTHDEVDMGREIIEGKKTNINMDLF